MQKGFRTPAAASKKEQMRTIETEMKNMQMASRISQMMTQQLMQSVKTMSDDLGHALNQLSIMRYNMGALQKHFKVDDKTINDLANAQRLIDFNDGAAKQDAKDGMTAAIVVGTDSTVTLTSSATDENGADCGIFRSRLKLAECGVPDLIAKLTGQAVGTKVEVTLNNLQHVVELLDIKNPPPAVVETATETAH